MKNIHFHDTFVLLLHVHIFLFKYPYIYSIHEWIEIVLYPT